MTTVNCPRCGTPTTADTAKFCRTCGIPLPESAPPPAPAPAWWTRRPGGRLPLIAGGAVAVLVVLAVAGYLIAVAVNNARYPPDQPVRAFFAALTARDTATAAGLATCTAPSCTGAALVTGYEPPTDVRIGEPTYGDPADATRRPDKSLASVPVTYRLAGVPQTVTVRVQRTGTGLARPFRISTGGTGRLTVSTAHLDRIQIGGARVPAGGQDDDGFSVLPGRYTVAVPDTDPLFAPAEGAPAQVSIPAGADAVELRLDVRVRPDVVGRVDTQVRTFLTACTEQTTLTPRGCPFRVPGIVIGARDVRWAVDQPPAIDVVPADGAGAPAVARTVTPGLATVTYTAFTSAGGDRSTVTRQVPVEVAGTVDVDPARPGEVVWSR